MKNLLLFTAIAVFVFSTANAQDEQYMSEGGFAKSDLYI